MEINETIVRSALNSVLCKKPLKTDEIDLYFHDDYSQSVDGKKLSRDEFVKHLIYLDQIVKKCLLKFNKISCDENVVHSDHHVKLLLNNGETVTAHVLAEFGIRCSSIYYCNEITVVDGNHWDIGSVF